MVNGLSSEVLGEEGRDEAELNRGCTEIAAYK